MLNVIIYEVEIQHIMDNNWPVNNAPVAGGGAADVPAGDDDDDFGEFGGFEAAEPVPPNVAQPRDQGEAMSSPWAVYASGGGTFRQPDLLCAQNAFPQYLDPSGISGAPVVNSASVPQDGDFNLNNQDEVSAAEDPARIAENVLDGTLNAATRSVVSPEVAQSAPAPLPDLGMGGNRLPLMRERDPNSPVEGAANQAVAESLREEVVEAGRVEGNAQRNEVPESGPTDQNVQEESEENVKLKKDLEALTVQNKKLEDDLNKTRRELEEQRTLMSELQERHVRELEEVKKAGHDALTVVVSEYKESSRTAVLEQQEVSLQHLQEALKQQAEVYQQMIQDQAHELKQHQEAELAKQEERTKKALEEVREEEQKKFEKFLADQREKETAEMQEALAAERESSKKLMEAAIADEQEKAEKKMEKEREKLAEVAKDVKDACSEDLKVVLEEERLRNQGLLAAAVEEERERGLTSARESRESANLEIQSYLQQQRQHDSLLRQRHLTSLDLFLASARQQLQLLMDTEKELTAKSDSKSLEKKEDNS